MSDDEATANNESRPAVGAPVEPSVRPLPEPAAWANHGNLTSARLGRERYGARSACELHTWREGGPTDYHAAALYTEDQMLERVTAEREHWRAIVARATADANRYGREGLKTTCKASETGAVLSWNIDEA